VCVKFVGKVPRTLGIRTDLTVPVLSDDIPRGRFKPVCPEEAASRRACPERVEGPVLSASKDAPHPGRPHPGRDLGAGDALRDGRQEDAASSARTEG